jgi:hypothetical protein
MARVSGDRDAARGAALGDGAEGDAGGVGGVTFQKAVRANVPLLIGIAGPSGAGKTYSALRLARGLAGSQPIAFIDTERKRALHYADEFDFLHAELDAPFTPARYGEAMEEAVKLAPAVIVVDSFTHEWAGEGGVLDMQQAEFERMGAKEGARFASWIKPKGEHKALVNDVVLRMPCHLILCLRAEDKIEIIDDPDKPGKKKIVEKRTLAGHKGWIPVTGKDVPYELTVSLVVTPDKPGVPQPIKLQEQHRALVPLDRPLDEETGARLAAWASGAGPSPSPSEPQVAAKSPGGSDPEDGPATITREQGEALKRLAKEHDAPLTDLLRGYGVERMGQLTVAQYDELTAFIAGDKQEVLA